MAHKKLKLPIGHDIFADIIDNGFDFIDKTLFIKEVIDDDAKIMLFTRPRRFGKTLGLSMLHHFLSHEAFGRKTLGLFKGFKICDVAGGKYMRHQGKYPVIFISLKDIKDHDFKAAYANLVSLFASVYEQHRYLLKSDKLTEKDKEIFSSIMLEKADSNKVVNALKILSQLLSEHFDTKVWLLIDEYDTPIQNAYSKNYYDKMISFMRRMFGSALKTNPYLQKSVITGILRVSKESMFSDLNNLKVYSITDDKFSEYFGFTQKEVDYILSCAGLGYIKKEVKRWYNGYLFGKATIYNPWSIINCVADGGKFEPYWINTGGTQVISDLIVKSDPKIKIYFEQLMQGKGIDVVIDKHVTFGDLTNNENAIFSMLLAAGYLKPTSVELTEEGYLDCNLDIPNFEISTIYRLMITQWLARTNNPLWFREFIRKLLDGDIAGFAEDLEDVILNIVSYNDLTKKPECFYHGLMLGITAQLYKTNYITKSNQESGLGRYDIAIIPKDTTKKAIVIELKRSRDVKSLKDLAQKALKQIDKTEYPCDFKQRGFIDDNIIKIGIAFCGKKFVVKW